MRPTGKILLDRKLLTWKWHSQPNMVSVWVHLLMLANYTRTEWESVTLERGQCLLSLDWLADFVGITKDQLRRCLQRLKKDGSVVSEKHHRKSIITVCKYSDYQFSIVDDGLPSATPSALSELSQNSLSDRPNNKNNKNNKENDDDTPPTDAQEADSQEAEAPQDERVIFARQLLKDEGYLSRCRADYALEPSTDMRVRVCAFSEFLVRERREKRWSTYDNFCSHFRNWLRFQDDREIQRWFSLAKSRRLAKLNQRIAEQMREEQEREWQRRMAGNG